MSTVFRIVSNYTIGKSINCQVTLTQIKLKESITITGRITFIEMYNSELMEHFPVLESHYRYSQNGRFSKPKVIPRLCLVKS